MRKATETHKKAACRQTFEKWRRRAGEVATIQIAFLLYQKER